MKIDIDISESWQIEEELDDYDLPPGLTKAEVEARVRKIVQEEHDDVIIIDPEMVKVFPQITDEEWADYQERT